ncbi:MAG: hypothetical protein LBR93_00380 [Treponema sp.]|jgi:mRNA-degrading endonuclease RelE of RelBE toxin-antitoxin system|nr:hypothetical protein [Treponema sp.]
MYKVSVRKKAIKNIEKAPEPVQILFDQLMQDLRDTGPVQTKWPNYSKLSEKTYHCHLNYSYVACWYESETIEIEVYYAGSREGAPY